MFQSTIVKKYISSQSKENLISKWDLFREFFHDIGNQNRIRELKEEQFQEGFLKELFVKIFGYIITPNENYNLVTELKNIKDSKKVDGALVFNDVVKCVIELKGTNTTDLGKVETQAFSYKTNQHNCEYVITSNFEKLRFYIGDAIDFVEFNLFELTQDEFNLMYLCLSSNSIENDLPLKLKSESISQEDLITKELYKDYSLFKRELYQNLIELNQGYDKIVLFKKSQKLLDRFLFLFFAEDKFLLPPNSVRLILDDWEHLIERDEEIPLYNRFKKYFGYLNTGFKGKRYDVFPYNGGLFKSDDVLDNILIDDKLLFLHTKKLSEYDFESEVDVNILGHIFENSLNEIEEITNELISGEVDKTNTKRKKDGVFYTPKYITKYIVDNTIGKLCNEKKNELQINDEDYTTDKKRFKKTIKGLSDKLIDYRDWLLQLTICDPACGSGAFLNQSLDFLISEHQYIDELQSKLFGDSMVLSDIENSILENNLFGVDINEESVEITKLSLWLRTAQPNRKLNSLSSNIKCGNSLIEDVTVAGNKSFKWEDEYPKIFENGGFDVVIGNPPYVPAEFINDDDKKYLESTYQSAFGRLNLYPIFYEKGINLLKYGGQLSFITPYTILKNQYYIEARKYILNHTSINELIDFNGVVVFEDATVDSIILSLTKHLNNKNKYLHIFNIKDFQNNQFQQSEVTQEDILQSEDVSFNVSINDKLIKRISKDCKPLSEIINFNQGIITGGNKKFITSEKNEFSVKVLTGSDFNRYLIKPSSNFITYDTSKLHRPRKKQIFEVDEKIILRQTGAYPICSLDFESFYTLDTVHNGLLIDNEFSIKYILTLLNSKLYRFLYENSINESGKVFAQVKIIYMNPLPIKIIKSEEQITFDEIAEKMIKLNKEFSTISSKFIKYLNSQFVIEKLTKKTQNWYELEFSDFIKELNKFIKKTSGLKLTKVDEIEWMDLFEIKKSEIQILKTEIDKTDREIDAMVYHLYNLTDDEIEIIESTI